MKKLTIDLGHGKVFSIKTEDMEQYSYYIENEHLIEKNKDFMDKHDYLRIVALEEFLRDGKEDDNESI